MWARHSLRWSAVALTVAMVGLLGSVPEAVAGKPVGDGGGGLGLKIQGYDAVAKVWSPGNTGGYAEGENIPFRIILTGSGTLSTLQIRADHLRSGVRGIEDLDNFQVCSGGPVATAEGATGCTAISQTGMTVTRDVPDPVVSGVVQVAYTFRNVVVPSSGLVLTWSAELAIGSHLYGGAALHMAVGTATAGNGTSISFGSKDVPIPVNGILATETDKKINGLDTISGLTVGETVSVSIVSKVFGPAKGTQNLTVTDTLPACLRYAGAAVPTPSAVGGDPVTVAWTFANVKNGTSKTVSFRATVVSIGSCTNLATTTSDKAPPSSDTVPITAVGAPDMGMVKTCDDTVAPGGTANCTLTYTNNGTASAPDVTITDVLDAGLTFVAGQPAPASTSTGNDGRTTVTWDVGDVAAGDFGTISYGETVPATGPAGARAYADTATVSTTGDPDPSDDSDTEVVHVTYPVDLGITKACASTIAPNTPTRQSVSYVNTGTAAASGTTIVDTLPAGMSYVVGSASLAPSSTSNGTITWAIGTVPALTTTPVTITYDVTVSTAGQFTNSARISSTEQDSDTADNTAECTTGLAFTDVGIDKACPSSAAPGDVVTHTLTYRNSGNQPAAGVTVVDTLGSGLTYQGQARLNGLPTVPEVTGQVLTFTIGTVAADSGGTISYDVLIDPTATSAGIRTFTDTAAITTTSTDGINPANDSKSCGTAVDYQPHLTLTKTGCRATVVPGGYQTYTLAYVNDGTAPATSAVLSDTPPAGQPIAAAPGASVVGGTATWTLGTLAPNSSGTRSLTVIVNAADGAEVSNTATLTATNAATASSTMFTSVSQAGASTRGSAYGIDVRAAGLVLINQLVGSESSAPGGPYDDQSGPVATVTLPGVVNAGVLSSSSHSSIGVGESTTTSTSTVANLNLLNGLITADVVRGVTQSNAGPFGAASNTIGSTFTNLVIAGVSYPATVAPNTVVNLPLGIGTVTLNGRSTTAGVDGSGRFTTSARLDMIDVELVGLALVPRGTHVIVGHSGSTATYPSGVACGAAPATVSARAFTAYVSTLLQSSLYVDEAEITPLGGSATADAATATVTGILTASALTNRASGSIGSPPTASSRSHAAAVNLLGGLVTADALDVTSSSRADGSVATTTFTANFLNLRVAGILVPANVTPNFVIDVPYGGGIAHIVLNEQSTNGDGTRNTSGTIQAVHVQLLNAVGALTTEVIVVSAHSGAHTS